MTARTLLQRVARPDLLARVFGVLEGLEMVGLAVGSLLAAALVALGGAACGVRRRRVFLPLVALPVGRRLLDIDRYATAPVVEIALLRSVPMLSAAPAADARVARARTEPEDEPNDVSDHPGRRRRPFYVIADGEVDVIFDGTRSRRSAAATASARSPSCTTSRAPRPCAPGPRLSALDRDDFLVALTGHLPAQTLAHGLASERLAEIESLPGIPYA